VALSIDDFYLTRAERQLLAASIHPLFATRGVPATHDLQLANSIMDALQGPPAEVLIPRFDKAWDDRASRQQWAPVRSPVDVIIVEGWCMGATAQAEQALSVAANKLEAEHDPKAIWRRHVNQQLNGSYKDFFQRFDAWVMLKAPSFGTVYNWRLEQEQKLAAKCAGQKYPSDQNMLMDETQILQFTQYYQRLTEHTLENLPDKVHFLFELDKHRNIIDYSEPLGLMNEVRG
jgi:D-glycerate 3-kinase